MAREEELQLDVEGAGGQQTYRTMGRILKGEQDLFSRVEGGDELYRILCEIF